jgi:hypothetical protein
MALAYLIFSCLAIASIVGVNPGLRFPRIPEKLLVFSTVALVGGLVASFSYEMHLIDAAYVLVPRPDWQNRLPVHFFTIGPLFDIYSKPTLATKVEILSILQSLMLAMFYVSLRGARITRTIVVTVMLGAAAMGFASLQAIVAGPDIFSYIGLGLSQSPYDPGRVPLPHADMLIANVWGYPLLPSPYGPVWNLIAHVVASSFVSLPAQALAFRVLGIVGICVSAAMLYRISGPLVAFVFALNPPLWQMYVAEAHNDIVAISLVLIAIACRRRAILAIVFVALAGAVKLPFLIIGVVATSHDPQFRTRLWRSTLGVGAGVSLSLALGGIAYVHAMRRIAMIYTHQLPLYVNLLHVALGIVAIGALAAVVISRRYVWGAPWSFVAFAQFTSWQYLGWGIPYAILDKTKGAVYLISLPLAWYVLNWLFLSTPLFDVSRMLLIAVLLTAMILHCFRVSKNAGQLPRPSMSMGK